MEVEVKFRVNLEDIKKRLEGIGAKFSHYEFQEDIYFSIPRPKLLRVRAVHNNGKAYLTYKEIRDERNGEFYEVEVEVENFEKTVEILRRLGFEVEVIVRKHRWVYKIGDITFELNRVEGAGDFLDIEVIDDDVHRAKEKIWTVARRLGLGEEDVEPRLYTELLSEASRVKKRGISG
ncbi:class IV adenylate cyclase [Pyrococcus yayanosii]|uniref:Adenylyl cyclase, CyaB-type, putative n=1 Tax=Pyrococcus yayanosii (strain CH1 / JCM 16557) TaxID=529709 RepID=F8AEB1_PYRYC|nr:class IV adenylate cyclase [Pyrococcus yayanosii]AEH24622.1 adenylyl cyclase, CyaB-type, putative [Pyrococcus yayanosii CH1]